MVTVLTIGGSDPTGGAGVQADLQTMASLGAHGAAVVTALTVQDTVRVHGVRSLSAAWFRQQLTVLLADVRVDAAKTGMLATSANVRAVAETMSQWADVPLVVDPVIRSTSGHDLIDEEGVDELRRSLLPLATLVTPNLEEAERLAGRRARTVKEMRECARAIAELGPQAVLVKGGHLGGQLGDVLYAEGQVAELAVERVRLERQVHGTGCALSSAAAVFLASGHGIAQAVERARTYVAAGLRNAVEVGGGSLVIDHTRAASELIG